MIDTGFGIYFRDLDRLMEREGWGGVGMIRRTLITHGDADHSGSAGLLDGEIWMHPDTVEIVRRSNRAYGSESEGSILAEVYTKLINLFSGFTEAQAPCTYTRKPLGKRSGFDILAHMDVAGMKCEVLDGYGGHTQGQVFYFFPDHMLLFTGDSLINFESLSEDRREFATLAKNLMTSVNVDSAKASQERRSLIRLIEEQESGRKDGRRCLVCSGHGAISIVEGGKLVQAMETIGYRSE